MKNYNRRGLMRGIVQLLLSVFCLITMTVTGFDVKLAVLGIIIALLLSLIHILPAHLMAGCIRLLADGRVAGGGFGNLVDLFVHLADARQLLARCV